MTTIPGADELRVRHILRARGVGPDATPPRPIPPKPTKPPRDWLDDILDSNTPAPAPDEPATEPKPPAAPEPAPKAPAAKPKKRKKRPPHDPAAPRTAFDSRPPATRQSLLGAWGRVPPRLKWLAYHAAAAGAGWRLGWVHWATNTAAWFPAGHWTARSSWVLYGLGICAVALYQRTRSRTWPVAWAAAVPVSSTVVGVLLYGTGYHH